MNTLRKLPIGVQDFEDLRTNNYLYVDKTAYIYQLITSGKPYFLSRPRRFGKSLFLSTLKAYFLGKKDLFEGLAIAGREKEWDAYPVIYIDFNRGMNLDAPTLRETLLFNLKLSEEQMGVRVEEENPSVRFSELIRRAYERTGRKVVVLVDEYDKPLLGTMNKPPVNDEIRDALKSFYGVLKGMDACLRFVFLTGVTKFSKASIFSDLNQLRDISMDERYAGVCGLSEADLLRDFQPELQALAAKRKITPRPGLCRNKKTLRRLPFRRRRPEIGQNWRRLQLRGTRNYALGDELTGRPKFQIKLLSLPSQF